MSSTSDGLSEMEIGEEDTTWSEARSKKEKRKAKRRKTQEFTQEEINNIIIGPSTTNTKTTQISGTQKEIISKNIQSNKNQPTKHTNYSPIMDEIKKQIYNHLFYINTEANYTRFSFTDYWGKIYPNSKDTILKTKHGLLLKTNTSKESIVHTLNKMVEIGKIEKYAESSPNTTHTKTISTDTSYSVIIGSVEHEIEDHTISEYLINVN